MVVVLILLSNVPLDCKKGGLVILRHNEIHDCIGDLASQVWPQVIKEPIVNEATATSSYPGLRLDLGNQRCFGNHRWMHCLMSVS